MDLRVLQQRPAAAQQLSEHASKLAEHLQHLLTWAIAPQNVSIVSDRPESIWHWQER